MIFIFANAWFFYDIFRLYEFEEKLNIEYQLGGRAKREDFHDDLRGSLGQNIEYQQGGKAKIYVFHGLRKGGDGQDANRDITRAALPQTPNQRKTWKLEA